MSRLLCGCAAVAAARLGAAEGGRAAGAAGGGGPPHHRVPHTRGRQGGGGRAAGDDASYPFLMHAHGLSCLGRGAADMSCPLQLAGPPLHMPVWQGYPYIYQYRELISTKQVRVTLSCCGRRSGRARRPPTTSVRWGRTGRGSGCASDVRYLPLAVQHPRLRAPRLCLVNNAAAGLHAWCTKACAPRLCHGAEAPFMASQADCAQLSKYICRGTPTHCCG